MKQSECITCADRVRGNAQSFRPMKLAKSGCYAAGQMIRRSNDLNTLYAQLWRECAVVSVGQCSETSLRTHMSLHLYVKGWIYADTLCTPEILLGTYASD